jgi:hypothetical protein
MMMKKLFSIAGAAIGAALLFAACSTSDDDPTDSTPPAPDTEEKGPAPGSDERPNWDSYPMDSHPWPQEMSLKIGIQEELAEFASTNDMACAIINGEIRACDNTPQPWENTIMFDLIISGEANSGMVTLKYYSAKLHRIFTVENWLPFNAKTTPTDGGKPYMPKFYIATTK